MGFLFMHGLGRENPKREKQVEMGKREVDKRISCGCFSGVVQFPFAEAKILNSMGSCMGLRD